MKWQVLQSSLGIRVGVSLVGFCAGVVGCVWLTVLVVVSVVIAVLWLLVLVTVYVLALVVLFDAVLCWWC